MLKDASRRKFDVVMAWAIDRLGRSLIDLLGTIEHLEATGVDLYLDQQNIDTTARLTGLGTVTVHRLKTRDGPGFVIDCVLQRRIATDWRRLFVVPEIADGLAASPKRVGTVP